jgi:hypothetical protein
VISSLSHHINKIILISIPSIFEDNHPRACTLVGIEVSGLWLESPDLAEKLLHPDDKRAAASIFVPFAQIAYLLEPAVEIHHKPAPDRKAEVSEIEDRRAKGDIHKKKHRLA